MLLLCADRQEDIEALLLSSEMDRKWRKAFGPTISWNLIIKMSHLQSATFKNKTTNQTGKQVLVCLYALRCCYKKPLPFRVLPFGLSCYNVQLLIQIYDHFGGWNLWCCWVLLHHIEGCFVYMDHPLYNSEGRLTVDVKEEEMSKSLKIK